MNYLFVGIGSIARKHITNIRKIDKAALVHAYRTGKSNYNDIDALVDKQIYSFEGLEDKYDAVFITNPTSLHYDALTMFKDKADAFFIEKPVFERFKQEDEIKIFDGKKTYIAAPLRFSSGVKYAKHIIEEKGRPIALRLISSSYLPEWRPNVDYRNTYSAHRDMGGGVHIDLIHELDYLVYLMGIPLESKYINKRVSNLEIDSFDSSISVHEFVDAIAEIHLDYYGRDKKRICELYYNDMVCYIDLINNEVSLSNRFADAKKIKSEDMYINEMEYFLQFINSNAKESINSMRLANNVLEIINNSEEK